MSKKKATYCGEDRPAGMAPEEPKYTTSYNTLYCDNCGQWCCSTETSAECMYCGNGTMTLEG